MELTTKDNKKLYSIGEASKICDVSKKTLRFYDQIGVVVPDYVCEENGYRYYSKETLLKIIVIKYYKQMGFKMEEMQGIFRKESYQGMEDKFREKILNLMREEQKVHNSYVYVNDWYEMLQEAKTISAFPEQQVSIRYLPNQKYVYLDQEFTYDYRSSLINIPWSEYLKKMDCSITGPVILEYPSVEEKIEGRCRQVRILQQPIGEYNHNINLCISGGTMAASIYHIGSHDTLPDSYHKIFKYIKKHGYICQGKAIERFLIDYWASEIVEEFVTEIIVPIQKAD